MMIKAAVVALTFVGAAVAQSAAQASLAVAVGQALGDMNKGFCLAFQDNQNDDTTTCFQSCLVTSSKIQSAFDSSKY